MNKRKPTLKELRKKRGVMKKAIAAAIGCSYQTYNKFEENTRLMTIEQLDRACEFFGVRKDDIFLGTDRN